MSIKKDYIGILLTAAVWLMSACTSDDFEAPTPAATGNEPETATADKEPADREVQLKAYSSPFKENRVYAPSAPAGFSPFTPDKATAMGVYMLLPADWADPEEQIIRYTTKWRANFEVVPDKTYTVYGYMPKTGDMASVLTKSTADAATLTVTGIKPVTTDDVCIITGVEDTDDGLQEGRFSWYWPIPEGEEEAYKIHILMDHLYAAAQFHLKVDAEYAMLRTIKLKTMTLSTNKGSVNATVTLTHNETGASPISDISYSASGSNDAVVIFNDDEGTALDTTTPLDIYACFAPTLSGSLTLVSTYDVYDRKGNLIRQNRTATNKLPNLEAIRGQRVQLDLTVNPTYLYVLSDPDLDNPTVKVEN
jgi:hypothetical protein